MASNTMGTVVPVLCLIPSTFAQYDTPLNTSMSTVGWVYGPNYRSTSDIIFSCVLTMSLCVWSALHLNIPGAGESVIKRYIRNTGWVMLGIFGPELIMFAAYKNYAAAKSVQGIMDHKPACIMCKSKVSKHATSVSSCTCAEHKEAVDSSDKALTWTMLHGYYAAMGGFVFDLDGEAASAILDLEKNSIRLTITPQGLQLLAECGIEPRIETREIEDKNKSDGLAKAIVILQAGWLLIQCVSRLAYSLPITLIEVNTVGHVICALFIYILWWKKPREVTEPTILTGAWVPALAAYMTMSSDTEDTEGWREWTSLKPPLLPELSNLTFEREQTRGPNAPEQRPPNGNDSATSQIEDDALQCVRYVRKAGFGTLRLIEKSNLASAGFKRQKSFLHHYNHDKVAERNQMARWKLALDAMEIFPHLCCRAEQLQSCISTDVEKYQPQVMLQERASNWPTKGSIPAFPGKLIGMALWLASIAFGAVHVAAWNEYFPSSLEKWLWRSSSLYLAWAGSLWLTICFLGAVSRRFDAIWDRCITGRANPIVYTCLIPVCFLCGAMYAFARVFLVVESIVALRKMPPLMYITPNWPEVIPHL